MSPEFITLSSILSLHFNLFCSPLNETLWNIQTTTWRSSVSGCVFCILANPRVCISSFWSLLVMTNTADTDRHSNTFPVRADRHDYCRNNGLLFENLPSQLMMSRGYIGLIRPRRVAYLLALLWASFLISSLLFLSSPHSTKSRSTLN